MLNYKSFGAGPPLVILHGLFGMLDNWQTLARRWADGYQVILIDLPNHGRSAHFDDFSYSGMADAVADMIEELGLPSVYLMGHSMGGKVAMQLALDRNDLVAKLVVVDMAPRQYRRGHDDVFAALHAFDPKSIGDRKEAAALMADYVSDPGIQLFLLKNLARDPAGGYRWRMNLPVITEQYENLIGPVGNFGDSFPHATLFVRGGKSGYVRDDDMAYIRDLFPAAQLTTIEGAGHWVHAERPERLFDVVGQFLAA